MNEIFISYSRKDKPFVQKLDAALRATGRDPWVDWQDIPLTADWWSEIQAGIEGADTFVFVISPDSTDSEVCNQELDHAALHHKRIVPLFYRDCQQPPVKVRHLNWVFCRENDDFESAFATMLQTMDTDLEWVKAHTRLTQRAVEWDKKNRNDSLLLRGDDLDEADQMLVQIGKKPELTELQAQYILTSRLKQEDDRQRQLEQAQALAEEQRQRAETERLRAEEQSRAAKRLRLLAVGLTLIFLAAIGMAIFAWNERRSAQNNERLAIGRGLIANAQTNLTVDPELSTLLTLQALNFSDTEQAWTVLQQSVQGLNTEMTLSEQTYPIYNVSFSSDETRLLTAGSDGVARVRDSASGDILQTIEYGDSVWMAVFSPNETRLATVVFNEEASQDEFSLWDVSSGKMLKTIATNDDSLQFITLNSDGTHLAATNSQTVTVWNSTSGEILSTFAAPAEVLYSSRPSSLVFNPDDSLLAATFAQTITLIDVATGQEIHNFFDPAAKGTLQMAFSPDGKRLATANLDNKGRVWEVETGEKLLTLVGHTAGYVNDITFSPDGRYLATASEDRTVKIWNAETGDELITLIGHTDLVRHVAYSPDGTRLISSSDDGVVKIWRLSGDVLTGHTDWVGLANFNADGTRLVTASSDDTTKLWNPVSGEILLSLPGYESYFSPSGTRLAVVNQDGRIELRNVISGEILLTTTDNNIFLDFSPDQSSLATAAFNEETLKSEITLWDTDSGRESLSISTGGYTWKGSFSPDGTRLITLSYDTKAEQNEITIWDATGSGRQLMSIPINDNTEDFILSPSGTRLWTKGYNEDYSRQKLSLWDISTGVQIVDERLSEDNYGLNSIQNEAKLGVVTIYSETLQVWDSETGQEQFKVSGQTMSDDDNIAFSSDGARLAKTGDDGKKIQVWEINTGKELLNEEHTNPITSIAFSSDGRHLAIGTHGRLAMVWDIETKQKLWTLSGHTGAVISVRFSPDGKRLATSSQDGTARLYFLNRDQLKQTALARLSRWWTTGECRQYLQHTSCPPDERPQK